MKEWRVLLDTDDSRDRWMTVSADKMKIEGGILLFYRSKSDNKMSPEVLYKAIKNWNQVRRN